jgi:hypothetical protein
MLVQHGSARENAEISDLWASEKRVGFAITLGYYGSPRTTADGLMNRSLSRQKPVTQSCVTGSDLGF